MSLREELVAAINEEVGRVDYDIVDAALKVFREWLGSEDAVDTATAAIKHTIRGEPDKPVTNWNDCRVKALATIDALASLTEASE